jgi:hypothetical protein
MKIAKKVGEKMMFSGGAEHTPTATVRRYKSPYSLHNGEKHLDIEQDGVRITLSLDTMMAMIQYFSKE